MSVAVVLGTGSSRLGGVDPEPTRVDTPWGSVELHWASPGRVLYRHG
jgi:hypothetical protein